MNARQFAMQVLVGVAVLVAVDWLRENRSARPVAPLPPKPAPTRAAAPQLAAPKVPAKVIRA